MKSTKELNDKNLLFFASSGVYSMISCVDQDGIGSKIKLIVLGPTRHFLRLLIDLLRDFAICVEF